MMKHGDGEFTKPRLLRDETGFRTVFGESDSNVFCAYMQGRQQCFTVV